MNTNTIFENENITIRRNVEKHGIEVMFPSRPSEFERQLLKDSGGQDLKNCGGLGKAALPKNILKMKLNGRTDLKR